MNVEAVLFDFDGILVDTEWAIYQAWVETFKREEQDLPLSLYSRCIGSDFDTWSPKTHLEEITGKSFDWEEMDERRQVVIRAALSDQGPMEGIPELLQAIQNSGRKLAVVSSSSHSWVDGWVERLELSSFFESVICKGDAPRIKPAPDLFLAGARSVGMEPGKCLVIEDSRNGLLAAKAAGTIAWIVPNRVTVSVDFTEADAIFPDFGALQKALLG